MFRPRLAIAGGPDGEAIAIVVYLVDKLVGDVVGDAALAKQCVRRVREYYKSSQLHGFGQWTLRLI